MSESTGLLSLLLGAKALRFILGIVKGDLSPLASEKQTEYQANNWGMESNIGSHQWPL